MALAVVFTAACGGNPSVPQAVASGAPFTNLGLPPCGKPPSEDPTKPPPGAVMPPTARLTAVRDQLPLVQLNGYVESTPVAVREWIESQPDLTVVVSEDEGYESELLVTDGTWRTFVKARAVCAEGSLLAEVIAPEDSAAALPTPAGSPAPPP